MRRTLVLAAMLTACGRPPAGPDMNQPAPEPLLTTGPAVEPATWQVVQDDRPASLVERTYEAAYLGGGSGWLYRYTVWAGASAAPTVTYQFTEAP